jgi:carbamoyl-phosphate synthase large subunit
LAKLGFKIFSTSGTAEFLKENNIETEILPKLYESLRPNVIDLIKDDKIDLLINTPAGKTTKEDETKIRSTCILYNVPLITTIAGALASVNGIESLINPLLEVKSIQEYHKSTK